MANYRKCNQCKKSLELTHDNFYKRTDDKTYGLGNKCRKCSTTYHRNGSRRRRKHTPGWALKTSIDSFNYAHKNLNKVTVEQYLEMFNKQEGLCAICNKPETTKGKLGELRRLGIDHDHNTGKIRELLCFKCNTMLGIIERDSDDIFMLYIKKHST